MTIGEIVKGHTAKFVRAQGGALWYETSSGFEFPIDYTETEGAVFNAEHKAVELMRWIRKHLVFIEAERNEQKA